jgi:hypothetical protein
MNLLRALMGMNPYDTVNAVINQNPPTPKELIRRKGVGAPTSRTSDTPGDEYQLYNFDSDKYLVEPGFQFELIPLIRKLSIGNQSVSQALGNIVNLANTGQKLKFNSGVSPELAQKMKDHLEEKVKTWHYGIPGAHGLANKLFAQAMISGATSTETILNLRMTGIYRITLPLPESIRFVYNKATITYEPHQKVKGLTGLKDFGLKKLNVNSFNYVAINGDTESPYGNPPYLPSLGPLEDQKIMLQNIKFIISQVGVIGFLEMMVTKPEKNDMESETMYMARLDKYINECKQNITTSMRDGVVVGYSEEHEFEFHSTSKNAAGVSELFNQNELLVFSGLKQDAALSGKGHSGAESAISIIFTKLLSELKNIQICVATQLKFFYEMELRLAGFDFKSLEVEFNPSTIQDDLKMNQSQEIKIRNLRQQRMDGIITQDQYAQALGHEKAAQQEPVVPFAPVKEGSGDPAADAQSKAAREKKKDASDRQVRSKNKPQGAKK